MAKLSPVEQAEFRAAVADVLPLQSDRVHFEPPAAAREYSIEINQAVARSLGLSLDQDQIRKRMTALESRK